MSRVIDSAAGLKLSRMPAAVRGARAAFVFFSRIPVGGFPYSESAWRWAPAHLPLVGLVVGGASATLLWAARPLGFPVAALLAVVASVLLTGALHEDGLADTCDALGATHGGKRALEILKDSRVGTYGALALVFSIALRVACLVELGLRGPACWVLAHCLGRTGPVWLLCLMRYVSDGPAAKSSLLSQAGPPQALVASVWAFLCIAGLHVSGALDVVVSACGLAAASSVTLLLARWFRARLGGITGDLAGAAEQCAEMAILVGALAALHAAS